jgi:hypothetical protein
MVDAAAVSRTYVDKHSRGAHYFAAYGRQPPAETLACTAVSAKFMVRMDPIAVPLRQR